MIEDAYSEMKNNCEKSLEAARHEFGQLRTGRATPALLDRVLVDAYGARMPINQLATIQVPEPRLMIIKPFDKANTGAIEKAIKASDLGLNPVGAGEIIRLPIPALNEERRRELVKVLHKKAEEIRVRIRNDRRDSNDFIKQLEKDGDISEDEMREALEEIQKITDDYIKKLDEIAKQKEAEILEV